ncbi:MAG: helix-turn-helix transcriptional regulator [Magnetococcales bacterium]|nr:helix-turn-helix transcriptional regulator [Magnetococcales bacterium]
METIGERLKHIRNERGLTQDQLAQKAGIARQTIMAIERGQTQEPRKVLPLCQALGISLEWLLNGEGDIYKSYQNCDLELVQMVALHVLQADRDANWKLNPDDLATLIKQGVALMIEYRQDEKDDKKNIIHLTRHLAVSAGR